MCTPIVTKPKICRKFTFYNQNNDSRTFIINISAFQDNGILNFQKVLQYLQDKGLNVDNYLFQLPQFNNSFIEVDKPFFVQYLNNNDKEFIFIMNRKKQPLNQAHFKHSNANSENQDKKPKQLERIIGNVIQKVKYWRWLYDHKGISLKQAAVIVDIPKKSLDDYYLQLRSGQLNGYNFIMNLQTKMGDLRSYNKKNQKKNGKLPQQLKKLKCFSLVSDIEYDVDLNNFTTEKFQNDPYDSQMNIQLQMDIEQQKVQYDFFSSKGKTVLKQEDYCTFIQN